MLGTADASVELVVTSPPYPMIEMWDDPFGAQDPSILAELARSDGRAAFEAMHRVLDATWDEVARVLVPGGFACINIGDATRSIGGRFQLFSNHARILSAFLARGFDALPAIIWRKQTNAPNKFMGSGTLPAGAYVTLEHEYILVLRKQGKRSFDTPEERARRAASAFFWEERNVWFSDVWDLKGTRQPLATGASRERSGAYPVEIPLRAIQMFSLLGDTVLDPFVGTGSTTVSAIASGRNSVGFDIADSLVGTANGRLVHEMDRCRRMVEERLDAHRVFIQDRTNAGKPPAHENKRLGCGVVTRQERELELWVPARIASPSPGRWVVTHEPVTIQQRLVMPPAAPSARHVTSPARKRKGQGELLPDGIPE